MRTEPVKFSADPLLEACQPLRMTVIPCESSYEATEAASEPRAEASRDKHMTVAATSFIFLRAQRPVICSRCSGYRAPCTVIFEAALSISRRSSRVSSMESAPMFSSTRDSFVVPGIGTIQGF
jgi:hypothetical protein